MEGGVDRVIVDEDAAGHAEDGADHAEGEAEPQVDLDPYGAQIDAPRSGSRAGRVGGNRRR
jgi:hypothetical protein